MTAAPDDAIHHDEDAVEVKADYLFAMLPEWVLYAEISAHAVRLYGVLNRYAQDKGHCWPSRKSIAAKMHVSKDTVDRALRELVDLGAVTIKRRKAGKEWTSSVYYLRAVPAEVAAPVPPPSRTRAGGVAAPVPTKRESDERESVKSDDRLKSNVDDPALIIAKGWWERQDPKPAGKRAWFALVNVVKAVADRDWPAEQITAALDRIGTVPSVAQLDRELRRKGRPQFETTRERQIREGIELAHKYAQDEQNDDVIAMLAGSRKELGR